MRKSPPKTAKSRCRWFSGVQSASYAARDALSAGVPDDADVSFSSLAIAADTGPHPARVLHS
eukprot:scaffold48_cov311-Pinguiococcus_pyrenoidosus.AAC.253